MTLFLNINILFQLLEIQQNYHKKALEEIEKILPKMKDALGNSRYIYVDGWVLVHYEFKFSIFMW